MLRNVLWSLIVLTVLSACSKAGPESAAADKKALGATPALLISPEDLITVHVDDVAAGPVITGTVQPERRADLRAEVSAVVLQILKDNGEIVHQGDTLVRLDQTAIRDILTAADASARASTQALEQAERQLDRLKTLRQSGMTSTQQLEDAEIRRNTLQSDLIAARARAVQARQQMQRTEVRAPFDGVISERRASVGDTVQIGKELLKVIDPASLRLEGLVSADRISSVQLGQSVRFRINGYDAQDFGGIVKRIAPAANPTTRQVEVLVSFNPGDRPSVAGLYAEGQIATSSTRQLMLPEATIVREGDSTYAWQVRDGMLKKTALTVAARDLRRGEFPVLAGLTEGARVVRNPLVTLKDGQAVEMRKVAAQKPVLAGQ